MEDIKLSDAVKIDEKDISLKEILFVSDINTFTESIKNNLINQVKNQKIRLVVFLGNALTCIGNFKYLINILEGSYFVVRIFCDKKKIKRKSGLDEIDLASRSKDIVGRMLSDYLESELIEVNEKFIQYVINFIRFTKLCQNEGVKILFYSGNKDYIFSYKNVHENSKYIPFFKRIFRNDNIYLPKNLELIKLNNELYLMGLHTDRPEESENFPVIKKLIKSGVGVEHPEKIIFASHAPGISKFKDIGSEDITNLKKKFKFKYHIHGQFKDFHEYYYEEGVTTKPVR